MTKKSKRVKDINDFLLAYPSVTLGDVLMNKNTPVIIQDPLRSGDTPEPQTPAYLMWKPLYSDAIQIKDMSSSHLKNVIILLLREDREDVNCFPYLCIEAKRRTLFSGTKGDYCSFKDLDYTDRQEVRFWFQSTKTYKKEITRLPLIAIKDEFNNQMDTIKKEIKSTKELVKEIQALKKRKRTKGLKELKKKYAAGLDTPLGIRNITE